MTATNGISIRKKPLLAVLEAMAKGPAPAPQPIYRGMRYTLVQDPFSGWRWNVLPANNQHTFEHEVASGFSPNRDAAEQAAHRAIDVQVDS
jgi:hypothetical protein